MWIDNKFLALPFDVDASDSAPVLAISNFCVSKNEWKQF